MSRAFPKPVVVVSKCLEFEACRYNGERISSSFIERLKPHVRVPAYLPPRWRSASARRGTRYESICKTKRRPLYQPSTRKQPDAQDERLFEALPRGSRRSRRLHSQGEIAFVRDRRREDISHSCFREPYRSGVRPVRWRRAGEIRRARAFADEAGSERAGRARGLSHENFRRSPPSEKSRNPAAQPASSATTRENKLLFPGLSPGDHARDGPESRRITKNMRSARPPPDTKTRSCGSSPVRPAKPHG